MKKILPAILSVILVNAASADAPLAAFSSLSPGQPLPPQFRVVTLPKLAVNQFSLVSDEGKTVLKVESAKSAGSLGLPLTAPAAKGTTLDWHWKINRMLEKSDMRTKPGDDFAARVYVFFDVPLEALPFMERAKIRLARSFAGADVPTAALCYVWDNSQAPGHTAWSPYTDRVRMIVLQSGAVNVNKWMSESRDIHADFRAAFGFDAPAVTGVAVGNDTDNSDEHVTTWYGDVVLRQKNH